MSAARRLRPHPERWDRVTWIVLALTAAALVMRLIGLGDRTVHHDESLHFQYAWYFSEGRGYRHDPLMHGPFQFHIVAAFFTLFGDSEFVGRLPHALFGTALVATPLLFRRTLNPAGIVLAAVLLMLSPSLLYYTRFAREDPFVMLWAVLLLWSVIRYREDGRQRWLIVYSAMLALLFATKEIAYLYVAMLLLFFDFATAHALYWMPHRARGERPSLLHQARSALWLVPVAWIVALAWPVLRAWRERRGWAERPREADLLVLTATLVLPLLAAAVEIPLKLAGVEIDLDLERTLGWSVVPVLLIVAAGLGAAWRAEWWPLCFVVFLAILVPLYSAWGTHMSGVAGIFWTSLDYWIDQHGVERAGQPWFYYLMLTPLYEGLAFFPALLGGLWMTVRRRDPFAALLTWWLIAMFVALSVAGEKMPWLVMHIALPAAFLAAYVLGGAAPRVLVALRGARGSMLAWATGAAAGMVLVLLFALMLWTDYGLNVDHPETPIEPFMYAQASGDVPRLSERIHRMLADGEADRVVVENEANLNWPWAWYLHDLPVDYQPGREIEAEASTGRPIIIGGVRSIDLPAGAWDRETYLHYHWPHEAGYKSMTWGAFFDGLADGSLIRRWSQFVIDRDPVSPLQIREGEVIFPGSVNSGR